MLRFGSGSKAKTDLATETDMNCKTRQTIRFLLGVGCVIAAHIGAFCNLAWYHFAVSLGVGCGLMGQRSIWEKVAVIVRRK